MSNNENTLLMERAADVQVYFEGTALVDAIDNCIERGDLEVLAHMVTDAEAEISRQEFHNNDILTERDEY